MRKQGKKLLAYVLIFIIAVTSVFTGEVTVKAGLDGCTGDIFARTNKNLEIVATLNADVTTKLELELEEGENVYIDGQGFSLTGVSAGTYPTRPSSAPALRVYGEGTVYLKNIRMQGGAGQDGYAPSPGLVVESSKVSVVLQENVTIVGGETVTGRTEGDQNVNGAEGIQFNGDSLTIDSGSNVTIQGADGQDGRRGEADSVYSSEPGAAMNFSGNRFTVNDSASLKLIGGNGGNGADGLKEAANADQESDYKADGWDGASSAGVLKFNGTIFDIAGDAAVEYSGGKGGKAGAAGTYCDSSNVLQDGNPGMAGEDGRLLAYYGGGIFSDEALLQTAVSKEETARITLHYPNEVLTYYGKIGKEINMAYLANEKYHKPVQWYTDENYCTGAGESYTITGDTDLYATEEFTISFVTGEGVTPLSDQKVMYPGTALNPAPREKTGYTFAGWYRDAECTEAYDFTTLVTENITLYAKWNINTYDVTFDTAGGSAVESQSVEYNSAAASPEVPVKTGYTFAGWYRDAECTEAYDFTTPVTENIMLYAKWNLNTYRVTFDTAGGSAVESQSVEYNSAAVSPETPVKTGYTFAGWYRDAECTEIYDFTTPVTENITLYAKWNEIPKVTPQPTVAPRPTAPVQPTVAPEPTATVQPTVIPEPTATVLPTIAPEPTATVQPTVAPEPTASVQPTIAPEPTATVLPTVVPEPTVAPEPTATIHPTVAPEPTVVPVPTVTPEPTEPVQPTVVPQPTTVPEPTVVPEPTTPSEPIVTPQPIIPAQPTPGPEPTATVTLNVSSLVLQKGKSTTAVKATLTKGDSIEKWESSDTKVATVTKKGKIKAKKVGTAVITVTTQRGASASVEVKVRKTKVKTEKLTLTNIEKQKLTLKKGKIFKIKTELTPLTSQEKITYKSSDKKVAKVSKTGKIKAVKAGKAVITVKSGDKMVKVKVSVKKK